MLRILTAMMSIGFCLMTAPTLRAATPTQNDLNAATTQSQDAVEQAMDLSKDENIADKFLPGVVVLHIIEHRRSDRPVRSARHDMVQRRVKRSINVCGIELYSSDSATEDVCVRIPGPT